MALAPAADRAARLAGVSNWRPAACSCCESSCATPSTRSPWHRERLAGVDLDQLDEMSLRELPSMTKADLMANFDRIVTDDRLSLELVNEHLETVTTGSYLLDDYTAVTSGGSTGERGVFVYDWDGWVDVLAERVSLPAARQVGRSRARIAAGRDRLGSRRLTSRMRRPRSAGRSRAPSSSAFASRSRFRPRTWSRA